MRISKVRAMTRSCRSSTHPWNGRRWTAYIPGEGQPAIARSVPPTEQDGR